MKIRPCLLAGSWYPEDPVQLMSLMDRLFREAHPDNNVMGVVSPHAGYVYSGQTSANAIGSIREGFDGTIIVIGPSHRGFETCLSDIPWNTPFGQVNGDHELVSLIDLPVNERAMSYGNENSLEIQVPFIRYRFPKASIVPIMMGHQTMDEISRVSNILIHALKKYSGEIKIVASSDFSHYVPHNKAKKDDLYAVEALQSLDVHLFYERIHKNGITACGSGPISVMILTLKSVQHVTRCDLISYTTSGEASGDYQQVVGYAALAVK